MPKTRLDKYAKPKRPPIDAGWGAVLVRQKQLELSLQDIADQTGLSYEYTRRVFSMGPPACWPTETRDKILAVLGLKARLVIEDAGE